MDHDLSAFADPAALSPSMWRRVAHSASELTLVVDRGTRCRFASHSLESVSGFTDDQLMGRRLLALVHPDHRRELLQVLGSTGEARWDRGPVSLTVKVCFADLRWHDVSLRVRRLHDDGDIWFLLNVRDETVQRRVEAALLRKTELEVLLERIQRRFNNSASGRIDESIESVLEDAGRYLGADRAYVLSYDLSERVESMTHEWCSESVVPELADYQRVSFDNIPYCMVRSLRGELVAISHPDDLGDEWAADQTFLKAEGIQSLLELPVVMDGRTVGSVGFDWITTMATWTNEDLTILGVLGSMFSQVLARKDSEQALERTMVDSQTRFAALVDNLPDPVMRVGIRGELLYANAAARRTLLLSDDGRMRQVDDALASIASSFAVAFASNETQMIAHEIDTTHGLRHLETRVVPERGPDGQPQSLLLVSSDLTERRRSEEDLAHNATHDPLTGLANRKLFLAQLDEAAARFAEDKVFAVLYLDLDRFKTVNDTYGHSAGDALLLEVSRRLAGALRQGDLLARLGGDEFTVLLPDAMTLDHATDCAQRLLDAVAAPVDVAGQRMVVTGSVGVALATEDDHEPLDLLHRADAAMYEAKEAGRARVVTFDPSTSGVRRPQLRIAAG